MWRSIHSLSGIVALVLVIVLTLSGAILSIYPVLDSFSPEVQSTNKINVADIVDKILSQIPEAESLTRKPSGSFELDYTGSSGLPQQGYVDINTGSILSPVEQGSSFYITLKRFHRALLLGKNGRILSGAGAFFIVVLSISGIFLIASRMGGFTRFFDPPRGDWSSRFHTKISRFTLIPLIITSMTGIYIVLTEFELITVTETESIEYPESTQGLPNVLPRDLHGLKEIPASELQSIKFPFVDDAFDVFTIKTNKDLVVIDQFTGDVLERIPSTRSEIVFEWVYALHTGEGLVWIGLILGFAALFVSVISATGVVIWKKRTKGNNQRIRDNKPANTAEIIVLVGSEGGTTWDFARSLHRDLTSAKLNVHLAPMNVFRLHYHKAKQILILASTYGNGQAPASADHFFTLLADLPSVPNCSYVVLGFGDRAFPHYCQFAKDIDANLENHGWHRSLATTFINRQSTQAFATWGDELAQVIGINFSLSHEIQLPKTQHLKFMEKITYGIKTQSLTAVIRFHYDGAKKSSFWDRMLGKDGKRPRFTCGDLLGILAPGSKVPRYYSISSSPSDEDVEICVKLQQGGECSTFLHQLIDGDKVEYFVRSNPDFAFPPGDKPVIMVSAGTGIAPFIGLIRANHRLRSIHLFWGGRDPNDDFLYQQELEDSLANKHLATLTTAFSRVEDKNYVQDKVRQDKERLKELLQSGASVMVCGGDSMAQAVMTEIEIILQPLGLNVLQLKSSNRYLEDVF